MAYAQQEKICFTNDSLKMYGTFIGHDKPDLSHLSPKSIIVAKEGSFANWFNLIRDYPSLLDGVSWRCKAHSRENQDPIRKGKKVMPLTKDL